MSLDWENDLHTSDWKTVKEFCGLFGLLESVVGYILDGYLIKKERRPAERALRLDLDFAHAQENTVCNAHMPIAFLLF